MTKFNFKKLSKQEFLGIPVVLLLVVAVVLMVVYWDNIKDMFNKDTESFNSSWLCGKHKPYWCPQKYKCVKSASHCTEDKKMEALELASNFLDE